MASAVNQIVRLSQCGFVVPPIRHAEFLPGNMMSAIAMKFERHDDSSRANNRDIYRQTH